MSVTPLADVNVPDISLGQINNPTISDPRRNYAFQVYKQTLEVQTSQLFCFPVVVNWHPITIIVSSTSNLQVDVSGDSAGALASAANGADALFTTITVSDAFTTIDSPLTAIRFTNTGTGMDGSITVTVTQ